MDLSPSYDTPKIKEYASKLALTILKTKGWINENGKTHKVIWTKFPNEDGYLPSYDGDQQDFYGLPAGWEEMSDDAIATIQKEGRTRKPYDERDKWAFELIVPTAC